MANTERWDERNILLRFAALSDLHIGESPAAQANRRFVRALDRLYAAAGGRLDALLVAGDITDWGTDGQIREFARIIRECLRPETVLTAAIGNHDEKTGTAVDAVSAALILADKTDVRRNRVRGRDRTKFDIHDRVNFAAISSVLHMDRDKRQITLDIQLDDEICSVLDYFEIFLERMLMCRRAAEMLGCSFKLKANGSKVL